jgi:hypothetical protein
LAEDSYSGGAAGDVAHMEMDCYELALADIVEAGDSTWAAAVATLADHTLGDHVGRVPKMTRLKQESWFVDYGRRWADMAAPSSVPLP